jgi:hypothetical protein
MFTTTKRLNWGLAALGVLASLLWMGQARADEPACPRPQESAVACAGSPEAYWSERFRSPAFERVINRLREERRENASLQQQNAALQQEVDRLQRLELLLQKDPSLTQIWDGTPLNDLLADAEKLQGQGIEGTPVPLAAQMLAHINVTTGQGNDNPGMLKNGGRLSWPIVLGAAEFQDSRGRVNALLPKLIHEAQTGGVVASDWQDLSSAVDDLRGELHTHIADLPAPRYIDGTHFLSDLDDALKALTRPDAANNFNGQYAAQGRTVPQLVRYMNEHGLQFAPAVSGDQASYTALYHALAAYDFNARCVAATV